MCVCVCKSEYVCVCSTYKQRICFECGLVFLNRNIARECISAYVLNRNIADFIKSLFINCTLLIFGEVSGLVSNNFDKALAVTHQLGKCKLVNFTQIQKCYGTITLFFPSPFNKWYLFSINAPDSELLIWDRLIKRLFNELGFFIWLMYVDV